MSGSCSVALTNNQRALCWEKNGPACFACFELSGVDYIS